MSESEETRKSRQFTDRSGEIWTALFHEGWGTAAQYGPTLTPAEFRSADGRVVHGHVHWVDPSDDDLRSGLANALRETKDE